MKIRLKLPMSGLRHGVDWPPMGSVMEVDDEEGAHLCQAGIAEPYVDDDAEKAVAPGAEKRDPKKAGK